MRLNNTISDADRFWSKVDQSGGPDACWPWIRSRDSRGYGQFRIDGVTRRAHIVAWFFTYGEWPIDFVLHHCDFPPCCNPKCLFQGTNADNMRDMVKKGRSARGERSGSAKLTEAKVRKIRKLHARGWSQTLISERYNIGRTAVRQIIRRWAWDHVL